MEIDFWLHGVGDTDGKGVTVREECPIYARQEEVAFQVLERISSAYCGKQVYFWQDDGRVYSRNTCRYLTVSEAVDEFAEDFED